jgi:hypothetical protein
MHEDMQRAVLYVFNSRRTDVRLDRKIIPQWPATDIAPM